MGRGDIKSKRGKRTAGSFGNSRPHNAKKKQAEAAAAKAEKPVKK